VFEVRELRSSRNPTRDHMVSIWGYSHMNFFSPDALARAERNATNAALASSIVRTYAIYPSSACSTGGSYQHDAKIWL
jgi:hypothetical protein